ncbi:MAG: type II secretion system protein GspL [Burkholderiaceae bacterium]
MSSLIVVLPSEGSGPATEYPFVQVSADGTVVHHANALSALLPKPTGPGAEVVAVVPVRALSWHQVELPKGTTASSPRLRAVLDGLLEDRLLDEPDSLHFALQPAARAGEPVWVVACNRAWLRQALAALEAAQRPANRIVPEFAPGLPTRWQALAAGDESADAQLVVCSQQGVTVLPLAAEGHSTELLPGLPALDDDAPLLAEPAVAALAEQRLHRRVTLQQNAQRLAQAAQGDWDLAQFDLASSGRARAMKRFTGSWRELFFAPRWRPARWGLVVLLLAHVLGLNAWAFGERRALQAKEQAVRATLSQTFPNVKVILDAPVQMEREVALLRQATGSTSGRDLEAVLSAFGAAVPEGKAVTAIEFVANEARMKGLSLNDAETANITSQLRAKGYSLQREGDSLVIRQEAAP